MKKYIPFILTLLFLAFLFYLVPFKELFQTLSGIKPQNFFFALLLYFLSQVFRTLRWSLFLKGYRFTDLFLINSANIMFNNILPARTGELSWFYYAKRLGMNLSTSLLAFVVARLYDLLALGFLLSLSLFFEWFAFAFVGVFLLSLSLLFHRLGAVLPPYGRLKELRDFFRTNMNAKLSFGLFALSLTAQTLKFLSFLVLLELYGGDLYKLFVAFAGGELSSVLPFHSFMGFGSYELAFSLPVKLLGESLKEWLKLGFVFHSFLILGSLLLGVPSVLLLSRR